MGAWVSMIKGVAMSMWVAFECGHNGMGCFNVSISIKIMKVGAGTHYE